MREFLILLGELVFIAILQVVINTILEESGQKQYTKVINIACILICYFLLVRYVYNNFVNEIMAFINLYW